MGLSQSQWKLIFVLFRLQTCKDELSKKKIHVFFFFIPQCHSMCKVFLPTRRIVLGFHRCYCPVRTCGCPFLWVQHSRTHSLARSNTSLGSCPRRSLSQFLSRDPWVLCLILVPWKIRCGRTCILPWPLQSTKKKKNTTPPNVSVHYSNQPRTYTVYVRNNGIIQSKARVKTLML